MRLLPIPTATTPAPNQARRDSSVGSTLPVGMLRGQGQGPSMYVTTAGARTTPPGRTLTVSQPRASASPISKALPQPALYGILRRLQTFATSGFNTGPTTNFAPFAM